MFTTMKLGGKIGVGFGIILVIAAILGIAGWNGVHTVRARMNDYVHWDQIDMAMNEEVLQNVLLEMQAVALYMSRPAETNFNAYQTAHATTQLKGWPSGRRSSSRRPN